MVCLTMLDHFLELQKICTMCLFLCLIVTLQMPNWGFVVLLYVFRKTLLFFFSTSCSFVALGKIFKDMVWLYICSTTCINSELHICIILTRLVFSFATITVCMLMKLKELIFNISTCLFVTVSCTISCTTPLLP